MDWKGKTGGGEAKQGLLMRILKYVDIRVIYCFLPFVVIGYVIFAPRRAYAIYSYLRRRQKFSFVKSLWGTFKNHLLFGKFLLDRFYIYAGHINKYAVARIEKDLVFKYFTTDKPLVMVSAHVGNFEISSYLCGHLPKKLNVLAFAGETAQMQKFRKGAMEQNNIEMVEVSDSMEHIFKINDVIRDCEAITLAGDRTFTGRRNHKFTFLGAEAEFPIGIYNIADRFQADFIAMFVLGTKKWFRYRVHVEQIKVDPEIKGREARAIAYGQKYVEILERVIRENPYQWFNFYDFWGQKSVDEK